jgi:hypothetical protein
MIIRQDETSVKLRPSPRRLHPLKLQQNYPREPNADDADSHRSHKRLICKSLRSSASHPSS